LKMVIKMDADEVEQVIDAAEVFTKEEEEEPSPVPLKEVIEEEEE